MTVPMPRAISALVDNFARDIPGSTVTAGHCDGIRWRVTAATDRVLVWAEYEARSRGRLQLKASQLFIDGEQVERAGSYAQLLRIFADPDAGREAAPEDPNPPVVELEGAPEEVRKAYALVAAKGGAGLQALLRHAGRYWYVCLENEHIQLRMVLVEQVMNHQRPLLQPQVVSARSQPIRLIIDGRDLTDQIQGRLDKALGLVGAHPSAPGRPAVAAESAAAVNTSVQVRKQSVMRI